MEMGRWGLTIDIKTIIEVILPLRLPRFVKMDQKPK
jgi:hypothetical protein